jgi:hypothetical protein
MRGALLFVSSLRDSVPFFWVLPRTSVLGYCQAPLRGWGSGH